MQCTIVEHPSSGEPTSETLYLFNRAPLWENVMTRLPPGSIAPAGWIRHQLELMARGMVGQLPRLSEFLSEENGWLGGEQEGWEEQGYWFRGFYDLACILQDEELLAVSQRWIEAMLGSMDADGYFGPPKLKNWTGNNGQVLTDFWPHMVMIDALIHHQEATGDACVVPFLSRFFRYCASLPEEQFIPPVSAEAFGEWKPDVQTVRAADMLPHLYWVYNRTGELPLLELAIRFYRHLLPSPSEYIADHVINFTQRFAYPAIFATQTRERWRLQAAEYWYTQHLATWGQHPRGIFGGDEHVRRGCTDPRQGFETCGFGEFAKNFYYLAALTGEAKYADRVEDLLFNHFPASQSPDLRGVHYLTASNLPQLDGQGRHAFANDYRQLAYSSILYRCCMHNVAMTWPWYSEHLWMASADGGLVAFMYGAGTVTAQTAGGPVSIMEQTDYPFSGSVILAVTPERPATFPLYLRIPAWCTEFTVQVNGQTVAANGQPGHYLRIEREWQAGDSVAIAMAMEISLTRWPRTGAATVERGPLSYSVKIGEAWRECAGWEWQEAHMRWDPPAGWPDLEVFPTTPWNYGLCLHGEDTSIFHVVENGSVAAQPWTPEGAPLHILAPAKRIPAWTLEPENATVQELQESPIRSDAPLETITLIPLGCARLRISCFPVISEEAHAREWLPAKATHSKTVLNRGAVRVAEDNK